MRQGRKSYALVYFYPQYFMWQSLNNKFCSLIFVQSPYPFKCSELWLRKLCCWLNGFLGYAGEPTRYGPTTLISGHIERGPSSLTESSSSANDNHVYRFWSIVGPGIIPLLPVLVRGTPGARPPVLLLLTNEVGLRLK